MTQKREMKLDLSFDPLMALTGSPTEAIKEFPPGLESLWSIGKWAWNIGQWNSFEDFEFAWFILEKVLQRCVEKQQDAWFCAGNSEAVERKDVRDIDWLDDGFRRGIHREVLDEILARPVPRGKKVTVKDLESRELGILLLKAIHFVTSHFYCVNGVISVDRALIANKAGDLRLLVARSIEAAESVRAGLGVSYASQARSEAQPEMSTKDFATYGALAKNQPMKNVKMTVQAAYLNGKWKSKLQAAKALVHIAHQEAITQGTRLSVDRGQTTVYGWIRELGASK